MQEVALAQAGALPETDVISVSTALLIILCFGLVWCVASLLDVKRRLATLDTTSRQEELTQVSQAQNAGEIPHEILAAIAAAVSASFGKSARIIHTAPLEQHGLQWSMEGRRNLFHSHQLRK